mmetsp:Transcript_15948/g.20429  ORF Transcript_15948/g.20429 Transcript_15948/m.20429 type:complete len:95 (+) Transcript_15948:162-446(+)
MRTKHDVKKHSTIVLVEKATSAIVAPKSKLDANPYMTYVISTGTKSDASVSTRFVINTVTVTARKLSNNLGHHEDSVLANTKVAVRWKDASLCL